MKKKRRISQVLSSLFFNMKLEGFKLGRIYKGSSKKICVPILNCYSCPGALGACPIGSIQAVLGGNKNNISFYVFGLIMLFGTLFGRLLCGFFCPFGLVEDLIYSLPGKKLSINQSLDRVLRKLKYLILALLVVIFPVLITNAFGLGSPYFCKYICPSGTLFGGLPLITKNPGLKASLGLLFVWKLFIVFITLVSSIFIYRPFCKYICPLGAFYSLFNSFSFYKLRLNKDKCINCGLCEKTCKMGVKIRENINSPECIRCGECKKLCSFGAID